MLPRAIGEPVRVRHPRASCAVALARVSPYLARVSRWKVLVADDLAPEGVELLRNVAEVSTHKGMAEDELRAALVGTHALIVRSATKVTAASLEGADDLLVIGRAGIGVDNVDVAAATDHGIVVMNTPESGAVTTAEHAVAMMLSLARRIPAADRLLHEGRWEKKGLTGVEITGKTLGLIGLGRIGRVVADRSRGLKMRVLAYDPHVPEDRVPEGVVLVTLARCLSESDFVSIHVPLLDDTRHLLDRAAFAQMKHGSRLIHCARGGVVDEEALLEALERGQVAGAALDVFEKEPLDPDHPLLAHPNVVFTPHVGASTEEARRAVACDMAQQVVTCLDTGTVVNGINVPRIAPSQAGRLAPFLELAQGLGSFVVQAFGGEVSSVTVELQGETPQSAEEPLRLAAAVGALRGLGHVVTPVNALARAADRGVTVSSVQRLLKSEYVEMIRVEAAIDGVARSAAGVLFGRRRPRLVEFEGTPIDASLEGEMLVTVHHDQPGVIGRIGSLLGDAEVNISGMQIGLREGGREALGLLNLDTHPTPELLEQIATLPFVDSVFAVSLS